jgi:hypothetical protein
MDVFSYHSNQKPNKNLSFFFFFLIFFFFFRIFFLEFSILEKVGRNTLENLKFNSDHTLGDKQHDFHQLTTTRYPIYLLIATLLIDSGQKKLSYSRFRYQLRKLLLESTVFPCGLPKIANTKYGQTR